MPADILTRIQNEIHAFSKGQKKIASYILTNYDKAAFMTASRLGKTVGVSESTVVRFAVELGCEGYPEMQKTLQSAGPMWASAPTVKRIGACPFVANSHADAAFPVGRTEASAPTRVCTNPHWSFTFHCCADAP